ncbi:uncharacterized protein LOC119481368 [Sebastes umbrosus]|uniref:uncharacterized protein LOC119481368 n=1 Tax=Sebastes umbrosus TaxID=72105 RepID=UPI00189D938F|nr:uncharacterized protein LOC119481368 [Sebastes umbrosus]
MLLLLSCWIIAGITAEDLPPRHYQENNSLCLKVRNSPPYPDSWWSFNETKIIVRNRNITSKYADKVEYNSKDHSLCIKKLTEADAGIYTFKFFISEGLKTETHRLIFEETVPKPVIRISALHSNLSAGPCNFTVNCSIQDDWLSSVCDVDGCRTSQKSLRKVKITIFTDNKSIACSGNNHVSTSNVSESIEATCFRKSNPEHEETSESPTAIVIVIVIVIVFVSLCAFTFCVAKGLFSTEDNRYQAETSTAQIIQSQSVEAQPQPVQRVSSSSSSQAEAFYENVDATQPCQTISPTISSREDLESKQSQKVDSVYSVLQVPKVTSSLGKKTQEASTSQCVTLHESEPPGQIDTLYSVLHRPQHLKSQHHQ